MSAVFLCSILLHASCPRFARLDRDRVFCRLLVRAACPYLCHGLYLCRAEFCNIKRYKLLAFEHAITWGTNRSLPRLLYERLLR